MPYEYSLEAPRQCAFNEYQQLVRNAQKGPLCNFRTTQAQISLRIRAGLSGHLMPAYRSCRYYYLFVCHY